MFGSCAAVGLHLLVECLPARKGGLNWFPTPRACLLPDGIAGPSGSGEGGDAGGRAGGRKKTKGKQAGLKQQSKVEVDKVRLGPRARAQQGLLCFTHSGLCVWGGGVGWRGKLDLVACLQEAPRLAAWVRRQQRARQPAVVAAAAAAGAGAQRAPGRPQRPVACLHAA